ncbi:hypothetical protein GOBAR_AA07390 [Gossypium barbadense]|uniref:Uncharacterized protein n=1 Tax=Gossypium barbadense TaxID=3634 RepID=A0A2P5YCC2_GOSBA|nr:hypothetical protein GOBAR_AA07390 [Gossypium barbadense]
MTKTRIQNQNIRYYTPSPPNPILNLIHMDRGSSLDDDTSVHLQINELRKLSETCGSNTIFEPQSSCEARECNAEFVPSAPVLRAPEKKLTLFALRLSIFEKSATGLGTLGFIWATVVLLGGFAITLDKTDFWFITIILLIEGTRIFSRSHELEWQHQATWSITDAGISSFRALRSSSHILIKAVKQTFNPLSLIRKPSHNTREVTQNPNSDMDKFRCPSSTLWQMGFPFKKYKQSPLLAPTLVCNSLCSTFITRLVNHNYGEVQKGDSDKRNRQSALNIFYALALAEALLFLTEKAYWEWKVIYCKLLEEVNKECELGPSGMVSIKRFFYDAYSRCVNGSIFDGLKMDMVTFAIDLLASSSPDEQLIGARILRQFAISARYSDDTLQKIGVNLSVVERLVEMLNWKDPQEEEIRKSAAEILSKLAGKRQNCLRVAGIPGAMESISSLLQTNRSSGNGADEIGEKNLILDHANYSFWTFNHLGLLILKKLACDHDNCGKIGNTRGLLPKIIDFTHAGEKLLRDKNVEPSQILTVKRSLQLVQLLASTTGATGKHLRKEISEVVFTISNIRDILRHGEKHPTLQKLSIEILTNLALEEGARERIGGTGGVLKELFTIFLNQGMPEHQNQVRRSAGEALAMLALETLEFPMLRVTAARILRNLCTYCGSDCFYILKGVIAAAPTVLKAIMSEENKLQEVMVGLAAQVFKHMTSNESSIMFERAGIKEEELAKALVQILEKYRHPSAKVPRIRRFTMELAIWMMHDNVKNIYILKDLGMKKELEGVLETTAELESFNIFSATVGLSRHTTTIHSLVETALNLLKDQ